MRSPWNWALGHRTFGTIALFLLLTAGELGAEVSAPFTPTASVPQTAPAPVDWMRSWLDTNAVPLPELTPPERKLRRFDIVAGIALPFAILYGSLGDTLLSAMTGVRALADQGGRYYDFGSFSYPSSMVSGTFLFVAVNAVFWAGVIAANDLFETDHQSALGAFRLTYQVDADGVWLYRRRF